ncbi:MAG: hypothetical protein U1E30_16160 [Rhodoblastus sp.]
MRHIASMLVAAALLNVTPTAAYNFAGDQRMVRSLPTDRLDIDGNQPVFAEGDAAGGSNVFIMADYGRPEGWSTQLPPGA